MKTYTFEQAARIFKTDRINNRLEIFQKGKKFYVRLDDNHEWIITTTDKTGKYYTVAKIA